MRIIDITRAAGDSAENTGTRAAAFGRYLPEGGPAIDGMPLENYCGWCRILTVPEDCLITLDDLRGRLEGAGRVVLRGGGSAFLCEEAAEYLCACGVKLVVTDAESAAPEDNVDGVYGILSAGGTAVIENAELDGVEDGEYLLFAFPVKCGGDEAPVRAVLLTE